MEPIPPLTVDYSFDTVKPPPHTYSHVQAVLKHMYSWWETLYALNMHIFPPTPSLICIICSAPSSNTITCFKQKHTYTWSRRTCVYVIFRCSESQWGRWSVPPLLDSRIFSRYKRQVDEPSWRKACLCGVSSVGFCGILRLCMSMHESMWQRLAAHVYFLRPPALYRVQLIHWGWESLWSYLFRLWFLWLMKCVRATRAQMSFSMWLTGRFVSRIKFKHVTHIHHIAGWLFKKMYTTAIRKSEFKEM